MPYDLLIYHFLVTLSPLCPALQHRLAAPRPCTYFGSSTIDCLVISLRQTPSVPCSTSQGGSPQPCSAVHQHWVQQR